MQLLPGRLINDRYEILELIGEGGFASVYRALDRELGRPVAVKLLKLSELDDSPDVARFQREARLLAQLSHPGIVSIFAFGILDEKYPYIVMEFLQGESLAKYLQKHGTLDFRTFRVLFAQVCEALACAHEAGIVHRDLNPGNILLLRTETELQVKLIDFGLSKTIIHEESFAKLTKTGFLVGSPAYMSPEMARAENFDYRSDVYAVGCIMYETVSGRAPFDADTPIGLLFKQQNEYPAEPELNWNEEDAREQVKTLILRCMQKDPSMRFQSCRDLAQALSGEAGALEGVDRDSKRLGIHGWFYTAGVAKMPPSKKAVIGITICCFAILAPMIFCWDLVLVGMVAGCRRVGVPLPEHLESRLAEYLKERNKPEQAAYLYEDILGHLPMGVRNTDAAVSLQIAAAQTYLSCANRKEAAKHLEQAMKLSTDLKLPLDTIMKVAMLIDRVFVEDRPREPEIKLRAALVGAAANCRSIRRSEFSKIMSNFLFRTDRFVSSSRCAPEGVGAALVAMLSTKHIVLNRVQDTQIEHIVNYVAGEDSKSLRQIASLRIANPGTSNNVRLSLVCLEAVLRAEGNKELAIRNLQEVLRNYRDEPKVALCAYQQLAAIEQQLGRYADCIAYLTKQRKVQESLSAAPMDLYPIDNIEMRCYIDMGQFAAARKIRDRMIKNLPIIDHAIRSLMPTDPKVEVDFIPFALVAPSNAQGYFICILEACYRMGDQREFNDVFMQLSRLRKNYSIEPARALTPILRDSVLLAKVKDPAVRAEIDVYLLAANAPFSDLDMATNQIILAGDAGDKIQYDQALRLAAEQKSKLGVQERIYLDYAIARYLKKYGSQADFAAAMSELVEALPLQFPASENGSKLSYDDRILFEKWFDFSIELCRNDQVQVYALLKRYRDFCVANKVYPGPVRVGALANWLSTETLSPKCRGVIDEILRLPSN